MSLFFKDFLRAKECQAISELKNNNWSGLASELKEKKQIWIRRKSPIEGNNKLNRYGATGDQGLAGAGVTRNYGGQWISGFTIKRSICTALKAEFIALHRGQQFATGKKHVDQEAGG